MKPTIHRASDEVTIYPSVLSDLAGFHLNFPARLFYSNISGMERKGED